MPNAKLLDSATVAAAHNLLRERGGSGQSHDALAYIAGRDRTRTRGAYEVPAARRQARDALLTIFSDPDRKLAMPLPVAQGILTKTEIERGKTTDWFVGANGRRRKALPFTIGVFEEPVRGRRADFWFLSDCRSPARARRRQAYQERAAAQRARLRLALAA